MISSPSMANPKLHQWQSREFRLAGLIPSHSRTHSKWRRILCRTVFFRKFIVGNEDPLNKLGFFQHGIPSLGPGRGIESFLATAPDLLKSQQETIEGTVEYSDTTGRKFEEKFVLNFASFENLSRVGDAPLQTIADSIKKLQENIRYLSNGMSKLSVLAYSLDDLDAERSAHNLFRKLRRVSSDGRKEIENVIDQEIRRQVTKG